MNELLEEAKPSFDYLMDRTVLVHGLETPDGVRKTVADIFEALSNIESSLQVELRLKQFADRTGLGFDSLKQDWKRYADARSKKKGPSSINGETSTSESRAGAFEGKSISTADEARKGLLRLLLLDEDRLQEAMGNTFAAHPEARKCLDLVLETVGSEMEDRGVFRPVLEAYLRNGSEESRKVWESSRRNDRLHWEIEAELREEGVPDNPLRSLHDYTVVLRKAQIDRQISDSKGALMNAEKKGDWEGVSRLAAQIDELIKKREWILSQRMEEVA
jgi:DNA primase